MKTLKHFILRSEVLKLWRQILNETRALQPEAQREVREWAKLHFRQNRDVQDLTQIKFLLSEGRKQMKQIRLPV